MEIVHIVLDKETWGTNPGDDIRSIGSVVIDPKTGYVADPSNGGEDFRKSFYKVVDNPLNESGLALIADTTDEAQRIEIECNPIFRKYMLRRDPKTIKWWSEQSAVSQAAFIDPVDLRAGLIMFAGWLRGLTGDYYDPSDKDRFYPDDRRIWAHGAAFDPPIITAAFRACGLPVPFHYRAPRDTRTAFDMAGIDDHSAWLAARPGPLGINHHALDDAICEGRGIVDAYKWIAK